MCHGYDFPAWEAECINNLISSGYAEPVLLIRDVTKQENELVLKKLFRSSFLAEMYDTWWLRRRAKSLKKVNMIDALKNVRCIDCKEIQKSKFSQSCTDEDIKIIESYQLDFILRFGFNTVQGKILGAAQYGVWSYHHDVKNLHKGSPPCFWEIFHGAPKTEAILQRLTDRLDGDIILYRGFFKTSLASYVTNLDRVYLGSADWCARVCAEIVMGQTEKFQESPSISQIPIYRYPTNLQFIYFLLQMLVSLIKRVWRLGLYIDIWNVGITENCIEQILDNRYIDNIKWIKQHKANHFVADPFSYVWNGKYHILAEDFDYASSGRLVEFVLPDSFEQLSFKTVMENPFHMSYPYIFSENGEIYCIPEMHESNKVILYKKVRDKWQVVQTLLEELPVVDPTLFKYHELYWLFFTLANDGLYGNLKLYAYYAESFDSIYQPHPLNPLKCDVGSSRSAGQPIMVDGQLYRPSQDCSETYGGAVVMNQVLRLSPVEFEEVAIAHIKPSETSPYPHGLHTINALENTTLVDSKRFVFDVLAWRKNLFFRELWD